jgi:hypothetical protein
MRARGKTPYWSRENTVSTRPRQYDLSISFVVNYFFENIFCKADLSDFDKKSNW